MNVSQPKISGLYIYPLKSAKGIALECSNLEQRGLQHDRCRMVVDESGHFITQRTEPRMALIQTRLTEQMLILNAPEMPELCLPLFPEQGDAQEVEIWGDYCEAWDSGVESANWISQFLGKQSQIVFMPKQSKRPVDPDYAIGENQVAFSDGFPLMLISEASLNDLNQRLTEPLSMARFRPNLVVRNTEPYAEDNWKRIRIGDCEASLTLHLVKPCSRCVLTTVDPESGKFSGKEPLRTLATYRRQNGKVLFGQNLIARKEGFLRVGMPVSFGT